MKVTLKLSNGTGTARQVHLSDQFVEAVTLACPVCNVHPLQARGSGRNRVETHDTQEEDATCIACNQYIGRIHVMLDTLFGFEEDRRVLSRYRVYS